MNTTQKLFNDHAAIMQGNIPANLDKAARLAAEGKTVEANTAWLLAAHALTDLKLIGATGKTKLDELTQKVEDLRWVNDKATA